MYVCITHCKWYSTLGQRVTTPDPAPICARIVAETQRHPGAPTTWSFFDARGCNVEFSWLLLRCWIQIFRSVLAMTSLFSEAPMFFTEDPEVIWPRTNVTTLPLASRFHGCSIPQSETLWSIQFPLKRNALTNPTPKYSKQIKFQKRSQRVWQCTVPFHTFFHVLEHAASPC